MKIWWTIKFKLWNKAHTISPVLVATFFKISPFLCIFLQLGCYIFTIDSIWFPRSLFCIFCREFLFENTMRLLPFINWHAYIELKKIFWDCRVFFCFCFFFFFKRKHFAKRLTRNFGQLFSLIKKFRGLHFSKDERF